MTDVSSMLDGARADLLERPPYEEYFSNAAIAAIRLSTASHSIATVTPSELIGWVHSVNLTIDPIAERLKFYKANSHDQGTLYLFCMSPELPVHIQAIRMLIGLQELRHELSEVATIQPCFLLAR